MRHDPFLRRSLVAFFRPPLLDVRFGGSPEERTVHGFYATRIRGRARDRGLYPARIPGWAPGEKESGSVRCEAGIDLPDTSAADSLPRESGKNVVLLFRFLVTCCAADATPLGVLVSADVPSEITENAWAEIEGRFMVYRDDGMYVPVLEDVSVRSADVPERPYLY